MPAPRTWTRDYEIGVPEVDSQHQGLFELSGRLNLSSPEDARACAMELYQYTRRHFTAEEHYLEEIEYPKLQAHKRMHLALISKLNEMTKQGFDSKEAVDALAAFYTDWLAKHIQVADKNYVAYANARGE